MFKKIAAVVLAVICALMIYAASKPAEYVIEREITIKATPAKVFPYLNHPKLTAGWMPWADMDPAMKMTFSGPDSGVGARSEWNSTGKMGTGSSTISEEMPDEFVRYDLEYHKPFKMVQASEIAIYFTGDQSIVKWSVVGHSGVLGRFMCLFMNMDKMVGTSFEKGLAKLKDMVEAS